MLAERLRQGNRLVASANPRPVLFVGCSAEALPIGWAIQSALEHTLIDERELQGAGSEHGSRGMTWVDAMVEGIIEEFCELVSAGDHSSNHSLQVAVAPFQWLLVMVRIIRIEFAYEDSSWSEGASDRSACQGERSTFCSDSAA